MNLIYANIAWYALIVFGLLGAAYDRHASQFWEGMSDSRLNYDIFYGALVFFLIICIIGLLKRKKWGYKLAVSANASLAILPITISIVPLAMLYTEFRLLKFIETNAINLLLGLVSLVFLVWLAKSEIPRDFV